MHPAHRTEFLDHLRHIVGAPHVLTQGDLSAYEQDWRGRYQGRALAVVRPSQTQEVARIVALCIQYQVSIVPQGGNTGLVVGSVPDPSGNQLVLSLQRLNQIRIIDKDNLTITVEAGCILQTIQQAVDAAGFYFPLTLGSQGTCTIGGNLATNAGGTQVLRFGNARELCLGLEVVTAQGDTLHGLSGLRKDNTGYDLRDLYIGSEGTLGIITAATLKIYPQPAIRLNAWCGVGSIAQATQLLGLAHQHLGANLTGFEVMSEVALKLVAQHFPQLPVPLWADTPYYVLLENSDNQSQDHAQNQFEQLLTQAMSEACASEVLIANTLTQARNFWMIRESISAAQSREGLNIKHDIALPVSAITDFVEHTDALLKQRLPGVRIVNFGHMGDGNLHYNVQCPLGVEPSQFLAQYETQVNQWVYEQVHARGGSISAEHGIGSLKVDTLPRYKDPTALKLMRQIKQALDPLNLLNPARVLSVDRPEA